jgi:hypothetical protein
LGLETWTLARDNPSCQGDGLRHVPLFCLVPPRLETISGTGTKAVLP